MDVCIYVSSVCFNVYVCMYVCMYVCIRTGLTYMSICFSVYGCMFICIQCVLQCVCMYVCMYSYWFDIHVYTYIVRFQEIEIY